MYSVHIKIYSPLLYFVSAIRTHLQSFLGIPLPVPEIIMSGKMASAKSTRKTADRGSGSRDCYLGAMNCTEIKLNLSKKLLVIIIFYQKSLKVHFPLL